MADTKDDILNAAQSLASPVTKMGNFMSSVGQTASDVYTKAKNYLSPPPARKRTTDIELPKDTGKKRSTTAPRSMSKR